MTKEKILKIVLIILGAAMISALGYAVWKINKNIEKITSKPPEAGISTSKWEIYENEAYSFRMRYPKEKIRIRNYLQGLEEPSSDYLELEFISVEADKLPIEEPLQSIGSLSYFNENTPPERHFTNRLSFEDYKKQVIEDRSPESYQSFEKNALDWFCYTELTGVTSTKKIVKKTCITEKPAKNFYLFNFYFNENGENYFSMDEFDALIKSFEYIQK